jgi:predicted MFS family arabinose efflux permease
MWADVCPAWVNERVARNREANVTRLAKLRQALDEMGAALDRERIDFIVLKGFALGPDWHPDASLRSQYDVDLYCAPETVHAARKVIAELGYEAFDEQSTLPTDHLPMMVRKTGWVWRGDFFDTEIPPAVDLHFQFWDRETEGIDAPGVEQFWTRRQGQALHPVDVVGYAGLHLLRHLLRGNVRPYHVYELAWFLNQRAGDDGFWIDWQSMHDDRLRRLEAISFRLAQSWFGGCASPVVEEEIKRLPDSVAAWFDQFARSPIDGLFEANKDELWLHLALLETGKQKRRVLLRKLMPTKLPPPIEIEWLPEGQKTAWMKLRRHARYAGHVVARAVHHARALAPTVWRGWQWSRRKESLPRAFWLFLGSACVFNFGVFLVVLLYNLYVLDLGFREDFIGKISSLQTAGSIVATLPAAWVAQRIGLRKALLACFACYAVATSIRVSATTSTALLGSAFAAGAALAMWPVLMAPAITQLTSERQRARAFSLFFATGISTGVIGGLLVGRLVVWFEAAGSSAILAKQQTMAIGVALVALTIWPMSRVALMRPERTSTALPRSPAFVRFLGVMLVWNLATGSFNPFFNAYFSRHLGLGVSGIGTIFAGGQLAQVGALLIAPLVLSRLGLVPGIASMQAATAFALAGLAIVTNAPGAVLAYAAYMSFQWMSEPGVYTVLMGSVKPAERGGASAMNVLATLAAQTAAAAIAGVVIGQFGYPAAIGYAAVIALGAAILFRLLVRSPEASPSDTVRS